MFAVNSVPKLLEKDPVILVTGASRGIGACIAKTLSLAGAEVILLSRNETLLKKNVDEIKSLGGKCSYWVCDVTDFNKVHRLIEGLERLDGLVNNAGSVIIKKFEQYTEDDFDQLMTLNVKSYFRTSQFSAKKMGESGGGCIINISSIMGKVAQPPETPRPQALYTLTKHAIEGLTKALSVELAPINIRVNSVCPTYVKTSLVKSSLEDKEKGRYFLNKMPLKRFAETADVSNAVLFLLSNMSSMITGESLLVDGGWTAH